MPYKLPRLSARLVAVVALVGSLARPAAQNVDWPNFRGPNHNGVSGETEWIRDWQTSPRKPKWRADVGDGFSSVAVVDGRVFTMGNKADVDYVYALEEKGGKVLWSYSYPCTGADVSNKRGPRATPTVAGLRVFSLSHMGHLLCLDYNTGRLIWSRHLVNDLGGARPLWGYSASPLVLGKLVIVEPGGDKNASVVALNVADGRRVWASGGEMAGYSTPVPFRIGDHDGVAVFSSQSISGRLVSDGRIIFRQQWRTQNGVNAASPLIWGDRVLVTSGYNSGGALIRFGNNFARALWSNRLLRSEMSSPVLIDGHIYGFDDAELRCLDVVNGAVKWRTSAYGKGALTAAAGHLIVQAEKGVLALVQATPWQFKEVTRMPVLNAVDCWTDPVLANGAIYVRGGGALVSVDVAFR